MINKAEFWSIAHVNYDTIQEKLPYVEQSFDSDLGWLRYFIDETPNGTILQKNVLYDTARNHKVYLAHITRSFDSIQESGKILSSSGCLVGSIYCTPIIQEGTKLRLHNLGEYIFSKEAPKFSENKKDVALLLVELEFPHSSSIHPVGIDYLKLGQVHFSVFSELSYLLSHDELMELKNTAVDSIRRASNLLTIIAEFSTESITHNFQKFYKSYQQAITELPILGYFLFEVLCEYIALFQKGDEVDRYHQLGELYCPNFKNLIFSLCPDLTRSFNLGLFNPDFEDVKKYFKTIQITQESTGNSFENYLVRRLCYLISSRFYHDISGNHNTIKSFWSNIEWDFDYLQHQLTPLFGHTIHRLLRNMHRYPNFYFYFDQYKALQVWNYWNRTDIALPYNAVLPKGEIGINPANPYLKYRVFATKIWSENGYSYITTEKELPLIIEPRLAELNILFMRKKSYQ
ncbi:MAG: hypothetical protein AAB911_00975 [Patescibacteria group bacterium]